MNVVVGDDSSVLVAMKSAFTTGPGDLVGQHIKGTEENWEPRAVFGPFQLNLYPTSQRVPAGRTFHSSFWEVCMCEQCSPYHLFLSWKSVSLCLSFSFDLFALFLALSISCPLLRVLCPPLPPHWVSTPIVRGRGWGPAAASHPSRLLGEGQVHPCNDLTDEVVAKGRESRGSKPNCSTGAIQQ